MDFEVQTRALLTAENEFELYARYMSRIMDEVHSVRRNLSDMSAMDYAMIQLKKTETKLDQSRHACRQFGETLEYAARRYANADKDVENRTPESIKRIRDLIERLRIVNPRIPFAPILPFNIWHRIWEIIFGRRLPRYIPGWVPVIFPAAYLFIPHRIPLPILYRLPHAHTLRLVVAGPGTQIAKKYINRIVIR